MATPTLPFQNPRSAQQYALDLETELGVPAANQNAADTDVLTAWVMSESASFPGYNGLGTELKLPGATPDPSNPQVYDYPNLSEGLQAAVDMMTGTAPQTTALAPQLVTDLKSGDANAAELVGDIYVSGWDGSGGDAYDAGAIASKLGIPAATLSTIEANAKSGAGASNASLGTTGEGNTVGQNVTNEAKTAEGAVTKPITSALDDVGTYILKGILSLAFAGIGVLGISLLTGRGQKSSAGGGITEAIESPTDAGAVEQSAGGGSGAELPPFPMEAIA